MLRFIARGNWMIPIAASLALYGIGIGIIHLVRWLGSVPAKAQQAAPAWIYGAVAGAAVVVAILIWKAFKHYRNAHAHDDRRNGSAIVSVPVVGLILAAALIAGIAVVRGEPQTVRASTIYREEPNIDRLEELRDRPTLAVVTYWAVWGYRGDMAVVEAMRGAAKSQDRNVSRAAQTALIRWGL